MFAGEDPAPCIQVRLLAGNRSERAGECRAVPHAAIRRRGRDEGDGQPRALCSRMPPVVCRTLRHVAVDREVHQVHPVPVGLRVACRCFRPFDQRAEPGEYGGRAHHVPRHLSAEVFLAAGQHRLPVFRIGADRLDLFEEGPHRFLGRAVEQPVVLVEQRIDVGGRVIEQLHDHIQVDVLDCRVHAIQLDKHPLDGKLPEERDVFGDAMGRNAGEDRAAGKVVVFPGAEVWSPLAPFDQVLPVVLPAARVAVLGHRLAVHHRHVGRELEARRIGVLIVGEGRDVLVRMARVDPLRHLVDERPDIVAPAAAEEHPVLPGPPLRRTAPALTILVVVHGNHGVEPPRGRDPVGAVDPGVAAIGVRVVEGLVDIAGHPVDQPLVLVTHLGAVDRIAVGKPIGVVLAEPVEVRIEGVVGLVEHAAVANTFEPHEEVAPTPVSGTQFMDALAAEGRTLGAPAFVEVAGRGHVDVEAPGGAPGLAANEEVRGGEAVVLRHHLTDVGNHVPAHPDGLLQELVHRVEGALVFPDLFLFRVGGLRPETRPVAVLLVGHPAELGLVAAHEDQFRAARLDQDLVPVEVVAAEAEFAGEPALAHQDLEAVAGVPEPVGGDGQDGAGTSLHVVLQLEGRNLGIAGRILREDNTGHRFALIDDGDGTAAGFNRGNRGGQDRQAAAEERKA